MNQEITRTEHSAPTRQFTVLLSPTRRAARLARLLTVAHLGDWGLPSGAAAHIVAELAGDALIHGRVPGGTSGWISPSMTPSTTAAHSCGSR